MRDLETIKQEIFKISEQRITRRRKIKTLVASSALGLVVCVGLVAHLSVTPPIPDGADSSNDSDGMAMGTVIPQNTSVLQIGKDENADEIYEIITTAFTPKDTDKGNERKESGAKENYCGFVDSVSSAPHTIIFTDQNGNQTSYSLRGNTITESNTDTTIFLSDTVLKKLKELLGL